MSTSYLTTSTSVKNKTFDKEDWSSAYCNVEKELNNAELNLSKGSIPKDLSGTFYRNGPGRLERGGRWVHHPFDGDGMISMFMGGYSDFLNHQSDKISTSKSLKKKNVKIKIKKIEKLSFKFKYELENIPQEIKMLQVSYS